MNQKSIMLCLSTLLYGSISALACTGISLTAADGSYIQARTVEAAASELDSRYVVIPRGEKFTAYTPLGENGLKFEARYGVVGLSVVNVHFITEGINEKGLSAGLFFFPHYGGYAEYDHRYASTTIGDLQVVEWLLSTCATVEEVKRAIREVRVVALEPSSVVHWRIGEPSGRQVVMEIVGGRVNFYENTVGVLTNSPGFMWHLTNLNNYVNLFPGNAPPQTLGMQKLQPMGGNSGFLGLPGDATPPSRFVRAAFYRATAPQLATGEATVMQCFHLLNNFDVPIGIEHPAGKAPVIPSATQWTVATDLTARKIYYKTMYNNTIRCIDLMTIDFDRVKYGSFPLDQQKVQPVEYIKIG
ncbi:MAG: choloylglycine hydrolase family protein [Alistipes sp.]|nr:choloylglycine hydrolase family protein [Alistipes sp.]